MLIARRDLFSVSKVKCKIPISEERKFYELSIERYFITILVQNISYLGREIHL